MRKAGFLLARRDARFYPVAMRRDIVLPGFVAMVFVLGALLAPPAYMLAQTLAQYWPGFRGIADHPFPRYVSRITMILAVVGLFPLVRALQVGRKEVGITRPEWGGLARGFVLALLVLGAFVSVAFFADARVWRPNSTTTRILAAAAMAIGTALVVAPLEELVFRGVLFGLLRKGGRWLGALVISSVIFSVVHFLQRPGGFSEVGWLTGFQVLGAMFVPDSANTAWLTQLLNLAVCGGILCWAYQRTGTLWFSIGLHAGWIFWLKLANSITRVAPADVAFWGSRKLVDGWGATMALILTALLIPLIAPRTRKPHEPETLTPVTVTPMD